MGADARNGVVPDRVRVCNLCGMQRTDAAQDVKKNEEVATEIHLGVKNVCMKNCAKILFFY